MIRIGIDNGANGAIVALNRRHEVVCAELMPTLDPGVKRNGKRGTKKVLDMRMVVDLFKRLNESDPDVFVVLEHAQVFPKEGRSTAFTAGRSYGAMEMALVAIGIPYEIVRPRAWQKAILSGIEGDNTKVRSVMKCRRRLPDLDLTPGKRRKPHDGLSDAGCMALYALVLSPSTGRHKLPPGRANG